jgi:hypothetical protein
VVNFFFAIADFSPKLMLLFYGDDGVMLLAVATVNTGFMVIIVESRIWNSFLVFFITWRTVSLGVPTVILSLWRCDHLGVLLDEVRTHFLDFYQFF